MTAPENLVEIWRGSLLESIHTGHVVVCGPDGEIVHNWGNADALVYPRSSAKMIQALPLVESGLAERKRLTDAHLALACASHNGARIHTDPVQRWLSDLGLDDAALRCGAHAPLDTKERHHLIREGKAPCQCHNSCSGKHAGFLTLAQSLGTDLEYADPEHAVQKAVFQAIDEVTQFASPCFGIDGCAAPNPATTVHAMARAMAFFASADSNGDARSRAAVRLRNAMMQFPELVAGEGRPCTRLMRACQGKAAIKFGAEGYFIAILPEQQLGVALKISDGSTRAANCAIAAILVKLGVLNPNHLEAQAYINEPIKNWRGMQTGWMRTAATLQ
ncbi:asparaginase [Cognatishimia maritima]|uniref:Asparaginase n=1 Tax=Cognatishimia maritima TaxID=870908 RepID=A0A1M5NUQ8_9RHOB|nr:asparaginase [Cognatishimia maritima]SHG92919.1 asparaginase [Cognatishimia maritima]